MKKHLSLLLILTQISCATKKSTSQIASRSENEISIFVGSCNRQGESQNYWQGLADQKPDVWLWLGDNIYADQANYQKRKAAYNIVKNNPGYKALLQSSLVIGTWDDHDYGTNDADSKYPLKVESQKAHLEFFDIDPWQRPGIYRMHSLNKLGVTIDFILLDGRYFKDQNKQILLGEEQWTWLSQILNDGSTNLTFISSGSPILTDDNTKETWAQFPEEKSKLLSLINSSKRKVVLTSGDKHYTEISKNGNIHEFTISGMTHVRNRIAPNSFKITEAIAEKNFANFSIKVDPSTKKISAINVYVNNIEQPTESYLHFQMPL